MTREKVVLTDEERRARMREYKAKWREKQKEKEAKLIMENDYKKLYEEEVKKTMALEFKVSELEKLYKACSESKQQAQATLQRATVEYNARIRYLLDCAKHAYVSMQFAVSAEETKGGN